MNNLELKKISEVTLDGIIFDVAIGSDDHYYLVDSILDAYRQSKKQCVDLSSYLTLSCPETEWSEDGIDFVQALLDELGETKRKLHEFLDAKLIIKEIDNI